MRYAAPGELVDVAAIRQVDLSETYKHGAKALAEKLGIDTGRAKALRSHLGIDHDPDCRHEFVFGKLRVPRYSDIALERMRAAVATGIDLDELRRKHLEASRGADPARGEAPTNQ